MEFKRIGYDVLFFGDSDEPIDPDEKALTSAGIEVELWDGEMATEERIAADITLSCLQEFVYAAVDELGEDRVLSAIETKLGKSINALGPDLNKWIANGNSETEIRAAVGDAAKNTLKGWFKNISAGERLGRVVVSALSDIPGSSLQQTVNHIEGWIYG